MNEGKHEMRVHHVWQITTTTRIYRVAAVDAVDAVHRIQDMADPPEPWHVISYEHWEAIAEGGIAESTAPEAPVTSEADS